MPKFPAVNRQLKCLKSSTHLTCCLKPRQLSYLMPSNHLTPADRCQLKQGPILMLAAGQFLPHESHLITTLTSYTYTSCQGVFLVKFTRFRVRISLKRCQSTRMVMTSQNVSVFAFTTCRDGVQMIQFRRASSTQVTEN